jgi:hypothetical protein
MNKAAIAVVFAVLGAVLGYWYRGEVQIAREQAEVREFLSSPPHVVALAPPTFQPAPLMPGWNPKPPVRERK